MPTLNRVVLLVVSVCFFSMSWLLTGCGEQSNAKGKYVRKGRKVEIVEENGKYTLLRNGKPYFIKGAGGYTHFKKIKENGGNSVRVWHEDDAQRVLDEAHKHGLTVTLGLWMDREIEGFNYYDKEQVAKQLERLRKVVLRYKDHPALLMWGVGNEVNLDATNSKMWDAVNEVAEMIHEVDPDHPTTTMLIGLRFKTIRLLQKESPAIDVISFNMFESMKNVEERVKKSGWEGPYIISEFGARGTWETYTTWWGAPLEQTSSQKATFIKERYEENINAEADRCLGSYVFYWGYKYEHTPTWFSIMAETGEETEIVAVMRELWGGDTSTNSGEISTNKAPYVAYLTINNFFDYQNVHLKPQRDYNAAVYAFDPDGDSLRVRWEVLPETYEKNRHTTTKPALVPGVVYKEYGDKLHLRAPKEEGAYRLYAYVYDGQNNVATASFPFFVSEDTPY